MCVCVCLMKRKGGLSGRGLNATLRYASIDGRRRWVYTRWCFVFSSVLSLY